MKTNPTVTVRETDRNNPVRRAPFHSTTHTAVGTPAPQAAGSGGPGTGRMSRSEAIAVLADTAIRNVCHTRAEPRREARIIMTAVQGACRDSGVDARETIRLIARIMVHVTFRRGGDVAVVTTDLVQGAIDSATSAGISAETAAAAAAVGALEAAGDEGWSAADLARQVEDLFAASRQRQGRGAARRQNPGASPLI